MSGEGRTRKIPRSRCSHTGQLDECVTSGATACAVCGETEHLRICLTCGLVTCCESRQGHDHAHFDETGHPFVRPYRQNYDFLWCYADEAYLV